MITAVAVTLSFVAAALLCCNCLPHSLGFWKARKLHIEKVSKLERLQNLMEEQLNESRQMVSSVRSLFTAPTAPPMNQIQMEPERKQKFLSTSCLDRYRLPTLPENQEEV